MRTTLNLNDGWQFALHRGFAAMEKEEAESLEYIPVTLPHDWAVFSPFNRRMEQAQQQGFRDRWGIGWYRRKLYLAKKQDLIYELCFDGIYENSTVWINDIAAGGRKYGYSSFRLDITELLHEGENLILVKADNTSVPADRWYSGAGIYRSVYLEILPGEHLDREKIQVITEAEPDEARIVVHTGCAGKVRGFLKAPAAGGEQIAAVEVSEEEGGRKNTSLQFTVYNPILWSAEEPGLYELCLQLLDRDGSAADQLTMRIGLRKVQLRADKGLFINGKAVKLKGVCLHQEAGCFGTAVQPEIWRERLLELKKIGCNALRLAHHIFMPQMLELCDELGFYVYEECFDKWTGGAYGRYYRTEWERDLSCMVLRDRNHPCILFWGVGNEVENQAHNSMLAMLKRHVAKVKELDHTRPVSLAMNPHFGYPAEETDMSKVKDIQQFVDEMKSGEIFDMDDRVDMIRLIAREVDLLCCNYQEQWYERIHRAIPDKAILGTETYMYFRGYEEKFQNFSDQNPWLDVEEKDYCIGGMIWTGIDYLGESMGYPAKGWSGALFATDMEKRPIAWLYQSYWTREPMVHFAVMDYSLPDTGTKEHWDCPRYESHWEFPQFHKAVIPYMIATNCEQVELHVNEKEFLLRPTAEYPNRMITGFLPYLPGRVTVIGKNQGIEVCRQVVETPEMAVRLKFEQEELTINGRCPFQLLLKVRACDKEGRPVFRESAGVRFRAEGPAYIAGVDNGDIQGGEAYDNDRIHLFQGRADVALVITGEGRIRVTAFAAGMQAAQAIIVSQKS